MQRWRQTIISLRDYIDGIFLASHRVPVKNHMFIRAMLFLGHMPAKKALKFTSYWAQIKLANFGRGKIMAP
jgi:hypothetical protein